MSDLTISISIDGNGSKRGAADVKKTLDDVRKSAAGVQSAFSSVTKIDFAKIGEQVKRVGESIRNVGGQMQSFGQSLTLAITAPLTAIGTLGVKSALEIDAVKTKITALVGDSERATAKMRDLQALAQRSVGVTQRAAFETFAQLKGIGGIADESINRVIASMGKLNAAFNIEDQSGFIRNLVQIFTQGFEVPDIKEAIGRVPIFRQLLQQAFGTDDPEKLRQLKNAGQLTLDTFLSGISDAINNDPHVANISESMTVKLQKSFERLKLALAPIGIIILDAVVPVIERLSPIAENLANRFNQMSPAMQQVVVVLGVLAAAAGPALFILGSLVSTIGGVVVAIGGLISAGPVVAGVIAGIIGLFIQLAPAIVAVTGVIAALYAAWQNNFGGIRDIALQAYAAIVQATQELSTAISSELSGLLGQIRQFWFENETDIRAALQTISELISSALGAILQFWINHRDEVKAAVSAVWDFIGPFVKRNLDILLQIIKLAVALINGDWQKAWDAYKQIIVDFGNNAVDILRGVVNMLIGIVKSLAGSIIGLAGYFAEAGKQIGQAIGDGIVTAINAARGRIASVARDVANEIPEAIKIVLGIRSPSRVAMQIGHQVMDGLAGGLEAGSTQAIGVAREAATGLRGVLEQTFFGGDFGGFIDRIIDSMANGSLKLKDIFGEIARNWRAMVFDMVRSWLRGLFGQQAGTGPNLPQLPTPPFNPSLPGGTGLGNGLPATPPAGDGTSGGLRGVFPRSGGLIGTIGSIGVLAGGLIGGRIGSTITNIAGGALTGLMLGAKIGAIGGPLGAAIGAGAGFLMSIFGGLFGDPKRKRDKNEKIPALNRGFADALQQLRQLIADVRTLRVDPDSALAKANELRAAIASGFDIQFESKKYRKQAAAMIAAKLREADALIEELRTAAEVARAAGERERRILPEFAGGVFIAGFRRLNGFIPGQFTGRDTVPAMLARGEMVLNPIQQDRVRAAAGYDVFKTAGIPGYAGGGVVTAPQTQTIYVREESPIEVQLSIQQDATGMFQIAASSPSGRKLLLDIVGDGFKNDELKLRRRGV